MKRAFTPLESPGIYGGNDMDKNLIPYRKGVVKAPSFLTGFTIIEALIGITFLAVIVGSILGLFTTVHRYFKDGVALTISEATARIAIEKVVRPDVREGREFSITDGGDTLNLIKYDGTNVTYRYLDNTLQKNGNTIGINIVKITGRNVFEEIVDDELVGINFGVRNEGVFGHFQEVHIETQIKLRN